MTVFSDATVCEAGRNGRQIVITRNKVKHPHIKPFGMGAEGTPSIGNPYHRLFNQCNTTFIKTEARAVHSGFVPINMCFVARSRSCPYIPSLLVNLPLRGSRLHRTHGAGGWPCSLHSSQSHCMLAKICCWSSSRASACNCALRSRAACLFLLIKST